MEIRFGLSSVRIATSLFIASMLTPLGSGGNLYVSSTNSFSKDGNNIWYLVDAVKNAVNKAPNVVSQISNQINIIKKAFSLTEDEVAKTLQITRKTLYHWKSNNMIPKDAEQHKFFTLYMLAKEWLDLGYPNDRAKIIQKINGETILSSLSQLDKDKTLFFGRYLLRELDNNDLI
ncbi:hypothetical protein [Pasteurella multocida]|uniref:hypothetical protein n=1 Tax=Pasteurella multocida TaxID=747 RepID=UPI00397C91EF